MSDKNVPAVWDPVKEAKPEIEDDFDIEKAEKILNLIVEGKSLTWILKEHGMPSFVGLRLWRKQHPKFARLMEEAKAARAEFQKELWFHALQAELEDSAIKDKKIDATKLKLLLDHLDKESRKVMSDLEKQDDLSEKEKKAFSFKHPFKDEELKKKLGRDIYDLEKFRRKDDE